MDEQDGAGTEIAIGAFHNAAARPELWSAALEKLADAFEANGCALIGGPSASIEPVCSPSLQKMIDDAGDIGVVEDYLGVERIPSLFDMSDDFAVAGTIPWSSDLDHRQGDPKFAEQMRPRWFAAAALAGTGSSSIVLVLIRGTKAEPFSEREIERLRRIGPHLRKAGNSALRLAEFHHEGISRAFIAVDCGAILLDRKGKVLRMNTKAEALMREALTIRDGFLTANADKSDAALQELVRGALARPADPSVDSDDAIAVIRPTGAPLLIHAAPLPISPGDRFRRACCVLKIVDPDAYRLPTASDLSTFFGFTKTEAIIAVELCLGRDLKEIAAMRLVTTGTVRGQLKSILLKTSTRRQPELVALLFRYSRLPRRGLV